MKCAVRIAAVSGGVALVQGAFLVQRDPERHGKQAKIEDLQDAHDYDKDITRDQNGNSSPTRYSWDKQSIQGNGKYTGDYTSDDSTVFVAQQSDTTYERFSKVEFEPPEHDGVWYKNQCDAINDRCEERKERLRRKYEEDLAELKAEWMKSEDILASKKATHKTEKADVARQAPVVAKEKKDVQEAKAAVEAKAHCPPELDQAESRLAALEAKPDKSPADVDEECELKKKILKLKACVEELRAAERVLETEKGEHETESAELSDEQGEESAAASAVPPQERATSDAKAAYEAFKARGVRGIAEINEECHADRESLEQRADQDVRTVEEEYRKQQTILGERVATHSDEKADVVDQKKVVVQEQKDVAAAKKDVAEYDHCPGELSTAESRLSELQAKPNKTPQDVDEECELKKKILELKACVERLRAAEAVLSKETSQYHTENADLKEENEQEGVARAAVPPVKGRVGELERMLAAAKAARAAICPAPEERAPAPAPEPEKKAPEPKSGAERTASTAIAIFAVLLSGLLRA